MPNSYADTTGNGVTTDYSIPFSYMLASHVYVEVNGVNTAYTWVDAATVRVSPAPANGTTVRRLRRTSQTTRLATFAGTTALTPVTLDKATLQNFMMAQEALDRVDTGSASTQTVTAALATMTTNIATNTTTANTALSTANTATTTANTALAAALSASGGMAITGGAGTMPRVATGGTSFEYRTPSQVASDIGAVSLASPAFTGTPTAPTATAGTNTTQISTTAFVAAAIAAISYAAYAPLASPALTGTPTAPTAAPATNTTQVATTAFVTAAIGAITLTPTIATQAQVEAATSNTVSMSPLAMKWHPALPKAMLRGSIQSSAISSTFTSANTTTYVVTWAAAHGLTTGDCIYANTAGLPSGWNSAQFYYVNVASTTTFTLHNTYADAIALTNKVVLSTVGTSGKSATKVAANLTVSYGIAAARPQAGNSGKLVVTLANTLSATNTIQTVSAGYTWTQEIGSETTTSVVLTSTVFASTDVDIINAVFSVVIYGDLA